MNPSSRLFRELNCDRMEADRNRGNERWDYAGGNIVSDRRERVIDADVEINRRRTDERGRGEEVRYASKGRLEETLYDTLNAYGTLVWIMISNRFLDSLGLTRICTCQRGMSTRCSVIRSRSSTFFNRPPRDAPTIRHPLAAAPSTATKRRRRRRLPGENSPRKVQVNISRRSRGPAASSSWKRAGAPDGARSADARARFTTVAADASSAR